MRKIKPFIAFDEENQKKIRQGIDKLDRNKYEKTWDRDEFYIYGKDLEWDYDCEELEGFKVAIRFSQYVRDNYGEILVAVIKPTENEEVNRIIYTDFKRGVMTMFISTNLDTEPTGRNKGATVEEPTVSVLKDVFEVEGMLKFNKIL